MEQMRHDLDVCIWLEREQGSERRRSDDARQQILCHRRVLEAYIALARVLADWQYTCRSTCQHRATTASTTGNLLNVVGG